MVRSRASLPLELIENERNRKITFRKRKKGLLKKAYELSTLCDVQVCLIMYENNDQLPHHQPPAETFPENPEEVKNILHKYKSSDSKKRRVQGLADYYANQTKHMNKEIEKLRKDSLETLFPTWDDRLDEFSMEQLLDLLQKLDTKIDTAQKWYNNKLMATQQCPDAALMHDSMPPTALHPDPEMLALGESSGNGSMMMVNENGGGWSGEAVGLSWRGHNTEYALPPPNEFKFNDTAAASTSIWENPERYLFGNHVNALPVQYGIMEHETLGSSSASASASSSVAPPYDQRLPLILQPSSYVQYCPPMLPSASSSQYQQGLPPLTIQPSHHHNMQHIPIKTSAAASSSQSYSQSYDDDDDDQVRTFYDNTWMNSK